MSSPPNFLIILICTLAVLSRICRPVAGSLQRRHSPNDGAMAAVADPCLSQCKDTHVYDMHTVLGSDAAESSSEFLRPLHTILFTSTSEREASSKLDATCKYNKAHHQCLAACSDTPASRALIIGLRPWSFICKNWKFGDLRNSAPCLLKNAATLDRTCIMQLENLKTVFNSIWNSNKSIVEQLGPMCRAAKSYDLCYGDAVGFYCGQSAVTFWQALSDVNNATILELLSLTDRFSVPEQCRNKWYDAAVLPPPMISRPSASEGGGGRMGAAAGANYQRQVSSRSSGADLTVERFWGKTAAGAIRANTDFSLAVLSAIAVVVIAFWK